MIVIARCDDGPEHIILVPWHTIITHDHDDHHEHGSELSEMHLRVRALETVLTEKGYVDPAALDAIVETYETRIGPHNGAKRRRQGLERSGVQAGAACGRDKAVAAFGVVGPRRRPSDRGREHAELHNMIVCTLCSCYPLEVSACRRSGTSRRPIARAPSTIRAECWRISASSCRPARRSASGTRPPRRASSWCRCARPAPRAGARRGSRLWSPAIA